MGPQGAHVGSPCPSLSQGWSSEVLLDPREVLQNHLGGSAVCLTATSAASQAELRSVSSSSSVRRYCVLGGG